MTCTESIKSRFLYIKCESVIIHIIFKLFKLSVVVSNVIYASLSGCNINPTLSWFKREYSHRTFKHHIPLSLSDLWWPPMRLTIFFQYESIKSSTSISIKIVNDQYKCIFKA